MPVQCVILDVDGTLVDSNAAHAHAWVQAFEEHGYEVDFHKIKSMIGMGGDKLMQEAIDLDKSTSKGQQIDQRRSEIFMNDYLPKLQAFPRVRDLVERILRKDKRIVIATASPADQMKKLLEIADVADLIEYATSSSDVEESKPAPDTILAALKKCDCSSEHVVMVGDTPYDITAATRAGVPVVALRSGGWDDPGLDGAIAIYDDPAALVEQFNQSPLS